LLFVRKTDTVSEMICNDRGAGFISSPGEME
jgi:hypothetical protein